MRGRRGLSLVEVVVYGILIGLVSLLGYTMFSTLRGAQVASESAYAVTQQIDEAIERLRRDLEETALATVQVWPPVIGTADQKPGPCLAMISARTTEKSNPANQLWVSEYGVPRWNKQVYWCLLPDDDSEKRTGVLVRWDKELTPAEKASRLPALAAIPNPLQPPPEKRVILRNVVLPGSSFAEVPSYQPSRLGGFNVQFVQREHGTGRDTLTIQNPLTNQEKPSWNTRLMAVELTTVETLSGKHSHCTVRFKVAPQH